MRRAASRAVLRDSLASDGGHAGQGHSVDLPSRSDDADEGRRNLHVDIPTMLSRGHTGSSLPVTPRTLVSNPSGRTDDGTFHGVSNVPCGILLPNSLIKLAWEFTVLIPVIYTVTIMPVNLFYLESEDRVWQIADLIVTIMFSIDMIVQFNVAYFHHGKLIVDRCQIAKSYFATWFIVDFVSLFPFDLVLDSQADSSNRLVRLGRVPRSLRLFRLLRLAKFFKMDVITKFVAKIQAMFVLTMSVSRFIKIFFAALLAIHLLGGFWHFLALVQDGDGDETWLDAANLRDATAATKYWASTYWALSTLTSVGYGDIHATNSGEYAFSMVVMLLGVIGSAIVVADILTIVSSLDQRSSILKERSAAINQLIITARPPSQLRRELLSWVDDISREANTISEILPKLPNRLRQKVVYHVQEHLIDGIPYLKAAGRSIAADVMWHGLRRRQHEGDPIWLEDSPVNFMVFIIKGVATLYYRDEAVEVINSGGMCGEFELLHYQTHVTTLEATTDCDLLVLDRENVENLSRVHRNFDEDLRVIALQRMASLGLSDEEIASVPESDRVSAEDRPNHVKKPSKTLGGIGRSPRNTERRATFLRGPSLRRMAFSISASNAAAPSDPPISESKEASPGVRHSSPAVSRRSRSPAPRSASLTGLGSGSGPGSGLGSGSGSGSLTPPLGTQSGRPRSGPAFFPPTGSDSDGAESKPILGDPPARESATNLGNGAGVAPSAEFGAGRDPTTAGEPANLPIPRSQTMWESTTRLSAAAHAAATLMNRLKHRSNRRPNRGLELHRLAMGDQSPVQGPTDSGAGVLGMAGHGSGGDSGDLSGGSGMVGSGSGSGSGSGGGGSCSGSGGQGVGDSSADGPLTPIPPTSPPPRAQAGDIEAAQGMGTPAFMLGTPALQSTPPDIAAVRRSASTAPSPVGLDRRSRGVRQAAGALMSMMRRRSSSLSAQADGAAPRAGTPPHDQQANAATEDMGCSDSRLASDQLAGPGLVVRPASVPLAGSHAPRTSSPLVSSAGSSFAESQLLAHRVDALEQTLERQSASMESQASALHAMRSDLASLVAALQHGNAISTGPSTASAPPSSSSSVVEHPTALRLNAGDLSDYQGLEQNRSPGSVSVTRTTSFPSPTAACGPRTPLTPPVPGRSVFGRDSLGGGESSNTRTTDANAVAAPGGNREDGRSEQPGAGEGKVLRPETVAERAVGTSEDEGVGEGSDRLPRDAPTTAAAPAPTAVAAGSGAEEVVVAEEEEDIDGGEHIAASQGRQPSNAPVSARHVDIDLAPSHMG